MKKYIRLVALISLLYLVTVDLAIADSRNLPSSPPSAQMCWLPCEGDTDYDDGECWTFCFENYCSGPGQGSFCWFTACGIPGSGELTSICFIFNN